MQEIMIEDGEIVTVENPKGVMTSGDPDDNLRCEFSRLLDARNSLCREMTEKEQEAERAYERLRRYAERVAVSVVTSLVMTGGFLLWEMLL